MAVPGTVRAGLASGGKSSGTDGYRPEVQGLRALAVLMVVAYHVWFGRVSGGVDIFLLISAFLISISFLRRYETRRSFDLGRYWLHLFKRLLPAACVVLIATLVGSALLLPQYRWPDVLEQTWASLFYRQNTVLASNSVDYYAADDSLSSPLQHFWSLSVQGQVFILWPLLFTASALCSRLLHLEFRRVVLVVFGVLFLSSLAFSVHETYTNQASAYFDTRARLWEFAFGTLLALVLPFLHLSRPVRVVCGWVGLGAMLSVGFLLDVQGQFPGYVALWPLVAAALVIVAGQTRSPIGVDRFLSWKPLVRMGDWSYALYLWHWPLLIFFLVWQDEPAAGLVGGVGVVTLSLLLAYLTTRWIERPVRTLEWADKRRRRTLAVLLACVVLVGTPAAGSQAGLNLYVAGREMEAERNNPGAAVLTGSLENRAEPDAAVLPAAWAMQDEWASLPEPCDAQEQSMAQALANNCSRTAPRNSAGRTIVVVGDSHAQQWLGAIAPLAEENNWAVTALLLGGCSYTTEDRGERCNEFTEEAERYLLSAKPDVAFVVATSASPIEPQDEAVRGLGQAAQTLLEEGIQVIGIRDNPRFDVNMLHCSERNGPSSKACSPPRTSVLTETPPFGELLADAPSMAFLDLTDRICRPDSCPAVIGNVRVYLDDNHLTKRYVETLVPAFRTQFLAAAGW
ncbi:acyltransferase family protein [Arthrobacter sp. H41]|uniref:acyltransferase family protein n=1 Tax=Arthrobacter sp. H41 TaxID=1312978 RepID=UPI0006763968|nr:acyltransferase family protein [Arthrobacter sp. H41]